MTLASGQAYDAPSSKERGLVSPSSAEPVHVEPGSTFSLVVNTATALTPPPGIQEPRAHRAFNVWLCARGEPLGPAPSRLCFGLPIDNLRPLASHSLGYRVDVIVPRWVAPSIYDLSVRFPGGAEEVPGGVRVDAPPACPTTIVRQSTQALRVAADCDTDVRLHLADGLTLPGVPHRPYPWPTEAGEFGQGLVALVRLRAGQPLSVRASEGVPQKPLIIRPLFSSRADVVSLEAAEIPQRAHVFWRISTWQSAVGPRASARFSGTRRAGTVSAVAFGPDGTQQRGELDLTKLSAREVGPQGCRLGHPSNAWGALGLLFLVLSRKLGSLCRAPPDPIRGKE